MFKDYRAVQTKYYIPTVEIKLWSYVKIIILRSYDLKLWMLWSMDEIFFINQNINIKKIAIGQGGDYTTCCLLDYNYLNK